MNITRHLRFSFLVLTVFVGAALHDPLPVYSQKPAVYYPAPGDRWQRRRPEDAGMDSALLEQTVAYAKTQASTTPPDFSTQVETFGRVLGPLPKMRSDSNRIIPTYSVAKSFLSTLCGLAVDRGMIKSVHDPMKLYATDGGYDSLHNAK